MWRLTHYDKPWTVNGERAMKSPFVHRRLTEEWRAAYCQLARIHKVPHLKTCTIEAIPIRPHRGSPPDTGACYPAVKAAIDGLVDAGVLDDDGPNVVTFIGLHSYEVGEKHALIVAVMGEAEE